eukprot:385618-Pyramimonas_sp.AAC.1
MATPRGNVNECEWFGHACLCARDTERCRRRKLPRESRRRRPRAATLMSARPLARIAPACFPSVRPSLPARSEIQSCGRNAARSPRDARQSPLTGPRDASGSPAARSKES